MRSKSSSKSLKEFFFSKKKSYSRLFVHMWSPKQINKLIKLDRQKRTKNRSGNDYLTNHLVKFLQNRIKLWRVGALRVCTGYPLFLRKLVVIVLLPPVTFPVVQVDNTH